VSPKQSVGPDYRPKQQKPTATVSTEVPFDNVHTLPQTPQLIALLTWVSAPSCSSWSSLADILGLQYD
jgi:hypothetical protein